MKVKKEEYYVQLGPHHLQFTAPEKWYDARDGDNLCLCPWHDLMSMACVDEGSVGQTTRILSSPSNI